MVSGGPSVTTVHTIIHIFSNLIKSKDLKTGSSRKIEKDNLIRFENLINMDEMQLCISLKYNYH